MQSIDRHSRKNLIRIYDRRSNRKLDILINNRRELCK